MSFPLTSQPSFYQFGLGKEQSLLQIVHSSNLTLLDNSALSNNHSLCRDIYDANTTSKLKQLTPFLSTQKEYMDWFLEKIIFPYSLQTTLPVIKEITTFQKHFNATSTFHSHLWQKTIKDSTSKNFIPRHIHKKERRYEVRKLRAHNQELEKVSSFIQKEYGSAPGEIITPPYSIQLLQELGSICLTICRTIKLYDGPIFPVESIGKASPSDCSLVGAALGKSAEQYNFPYKISLLTRDYDIPKLFHHYLSQDSSFPHLFSNINIYILSEENKELTQKIEF